MQQTLLTSEQYRNLTKKIILSIEKRHRTDVVFEAVIG